MTCGLWIVAVGNGNGVSLQILAKPDRGFNISKYKTNYRIVQYVQSSICDAGDVFYVCPGSPIRVSRVNALASATMCANTRQRSTGANGTGRRNFVRRERIKTGLGEGGGRRLPAVCGNYDSARDHLC